MFFAERKGASEQNAKMNNTGIVENKKTGERPEQIFQSLINSIDGIVWEADAKTFHFSFVSNAAEVMLGYPVHEWIDSPSFWIDHIHPEDRQFALSYCSACSREKKSHELEYRMIAANGNIVWLHDRVSVIVENNEAVYLRGIMTNITLRKKSEKILKESEERYRKIVETSLEGIWMIDENFHTTFVNDRMGTILGYTKSEMIGKNVLDFHTHENKIIVLQNLKQRRLGVSGSYEFKFFTKDKKEVWTLMSISPILIDGEYKGALAMVMDITERKIAEQKVNQSEMRFRALIENNYDGIVLRDENFSIIYSSSSAERILGWTDTEKVGKNFIGATHPDDLEKVIASHQEVLRNPGKSFPLVFRTKHQAGHYVWVERVLTNMLHDKCVNAIVANFREVTERKNAEQVIKSSEERYRYLFNNNPACIFVWDFNNYKILEVNDTAIRQYGYTHEEFLELSVLDLRHVDERNKIIEFAEKAKNDPEFKEVITWKHINKKGKELFMNITSHKVIYNDKPVILALANNITELVLLEKKIAKEKIIRQKEITEAVMTAQEKERSEIGRELHDNINQLLGATRLYIDMAKKDEKNRESLLSSSSQFTLTAIEEIRKLSKTLITPLITEIGLADAIKDIIEGLMLVHPVKINFIAKDFKEEILNEKFKLNLFRIIQEQLNNILKHAHASDIEINFSIASKKLFISISDNGIGFDTKKRKKGIGILNIRSRAELYKGDVQIKSEPGKGCFLLITFLLKNLLLAE